MKTICEASCCTLSETSSPQTRLRVPTYCTAWPQEEEEVVGVMVEEEDGTVVDIGVDDSLVSTRLESAAPDELNELLSSNQKTTAFQWPEAVARTHRVSSSSQG